MGGAVHKLDEPAHPTRPISHDRIAGLWQTLEEGHPTKTASLNPVYRIELYTGSSSRSQVLNIYVPQDGGARLVRGDGSRTYSFEDLALYSFAAQSFKTAFQDRKAR